MYLHFSLGGKKISEVVIQEKKIELITDKEVLKQKDDFKSSIVWQNKEHLSLNTYKYYKETFSWFVIPWLLWMLKKILKLSGKTNSITFATEAWNLFQYPK